MGTVITELQEEGYKLMGAAFEVYSQTPPAKPEA